MPDRKKVIKGLEYCITHYNCRDNRKPDCPYLDLCEPIKDATGNTLMRDALALLKEQEAEIRQLRLALDIVKGTCKGIKVERSVK